MSFRTNKSQQMHMEDKLYTLTEREKKILKDSWAEDFSKYIFPNIEEEPFAVLYSANSASKPNTPVNIIVGLFMLKEMFEHSDEDLMWQMLFNYQYQYALHTTSFAEQPINESTLRRFRNRLAEYEAKTGIDLIKQTFNTLTEKISGIMEINPAIKRVDSAMISAGCRRLSRLNIMRETLRLASKELKTNGKETQTSSKYYSDEQVDEGYRLKGETVRQKMEEMLQDAITMQTEYPEELKPREMYTTLSRMIEGQSKPADDGRKLKEGKEITPESMQTPHDPEATYRKKNETDNIGYVGNFVETCDGEKNLITDYDLQKNTYSDIKFAEDILDALPDGETKTIITDGAYNTTEIQIKVGDKGVELIANTMLGGLEGTFETQFGIDKAGDNVITTCPAGRKPIKTRRGKSCYLAHFENPAICESCPNYDRCPVLLLKKTAQIRITDTALMKAEYAQKLETDKYLALLNKRNGVEGVPSVLRRKYRIDRMRDKGVVRKRQRLGLKVMAINAKRLSAWLALSTNNGFIPDDSRADLFLFASRHFIARLFYAFFKFPVCA